MRIDLSTLARSADAEPRIARQWLALALGGLIFAGLFALAVVIGRMPPFDRAVTDPLFFKRCLVAHVNLALVVWFYAFVAALLFLLPARRRAGPLARGSVWVAAAGVVLLLLGAASPSGRPLLSNYIPTIDGRLFPLGQLVFALGVLLAILDRRVLPWEETPGGAMPPAAATGLRAAALGLLLAALTLVVTLVTGVDGLPSEVQHDFMVWGLGHVLQLVSAIAMVTAWLLLLAPVLGSSPVSRAAASPLFIAMVLPWTAAPLFALGGASSFAYRHGFTFLMRWCLFPVVTVFLVLCAGAVARAWRAGHLGWSTFRDPRLPAFVTSVSLTVLGFALGAAIRGSNTMVPAHYHASVGAVTVAFMAVTLMLLPAFGVAIPAGWPRRAAAIQASLYGLGMLVFAGGFALAGAHGMGRKLYGAEQAARELPATIGLGLMGLGGFVAIAGGILFLAVVCVSGWRAARARRAQDMPAAPELMEVAK